jgi:predicted amidohydrolase YtcJ
VHFLGTGQVASGLSLKEKTRPEDFLSIELRPEYFRDDWLVGFGWNDNLWQGKKVLSRMLLDQVSPNHPVCFIRKDGHAVWVNSLALELAGIKPGTPNPAGGRIGKDEKNQLTGLLVDGAKHLIDSILPSYNRAQIKNCLRRSRDIFNQAGFTHLRDMSSDLQQFQILREMEQDGELRAYLELNFFCADMKQFETQLSDLQEARRTLSKNLRVQGIKLFFDGALGSQGALLSHCYCGSISKGLQLWTLGEIEEIFCRTWALGFAVSVHTIGDEAVDQITNKVLELQTKGFRGPWNLEHVEIVRSETLELIKSAGPTCHMQPSHWISDHHWLEKSIGPLARLAFPWRGLEDRGVPLFFGSDSPIEKPSLELSLQALRASALAGVPALLGEWQKHHSYPDPTWGNECWTTIDEKNNIQTHFDGKLLVRTE